MANFNGQWVEIFTVGKQVDNAGREWDITTDFLEQISGSYNPAQHEAPAAVGHPEGDAPAYGWVSALRTKDGRLEAQFRDVDPQFEQLVRDGKFKKRSASFYVDKESAPSGRAPYLRHVGFLGAQPPAVKGLRDIHFSEGESLTFESITFSEGDTSMNEQETQSLAERIGEFLKKFLPKKDEGSQPSFAEADLTAKIAEAVKSATAAATASFTEQMTKLETANKALQNQIEQQANSTTRAELINFCERLGPAKCPPAFRNMGVVEFMESISAVESKITVISFEEADGKKTEKKTESTPLAWFQEFLGSLGPFIQFGERFGAMTAKAGADDLISPERKAELRQGAGLPAKGGAN